MIKNNKFTRSQILTFGSFLVLVGVFVISFGQLQILKEEVFEQVKLSLLDAGESDTSTILIDDAEDVTNVVENTTNNSTKDTNINYNYNYIGYLEIPKIKLKRGFLSKDSKYNNIEYNIKVSEQAVFPDENGNFILIGHSGYGYIAFFAKLYKLDIGDYAYVTYKGEKYKYQLVKVEEQPKTGVVAIHRPNYDVNGLTLITCTKDNDTTQTIYIFELV